MFRGVMTGPWCAVCNQRIAAMTQCTKVPNWSVVYRVECHGQTESTEISMKDVQSWGPNAKITGGIAFKSAAKAAAGAAGRPMV